MTDCKEFKCPDGMKCPHDLSCVDCFYALLCNPDFKEEYEEMRKAINGD